MFVLGVVFVVNVGRVFVCVWNLCVCLGVCGCVFVVGVCGVCLVCVSVCFVVVCVVYVCGVEMCVSLFVFGLCVCVWRVCV